MKIVGFDIYSYALGYAHGTYIMSGNRAAHTEDGTVVRIRTDEGLSGWGEITTPRHSFRSPEQKRRSAPKRPKRYTR